MQFIIDAVRWYVFSVPAFLWVILVNYLRHFWFVYGIGRHTRTLFLPWKRQAISRKSKGFDIEDALNTFTFNSISRIIGACVRLSTVILGIMVECMFLMFWLVLVGLSVVSFPLCLVLYSWHQKHYPNLKKKLDHYSTDPASLQHAISQDDYCNEAIARLELSAEQTNIIDAVSLEYTDEANSYHSLTHLHLSLLRIALKHPQFQILLAQNTLVHDDIDLVFDWLIHRDSQDRADAQFWTREKLQETRSIGKDWAYGFTPTLDLYSTDIAQEHTTPYNFNVHQHITQNIETIFSNPRSQTVVLSGPPGVGKKTLVYFLAKRIFDGVTTPELANYRVLLLNLDAVLATTTGKEQKHSVIESLLKEAHTAGNIILVIEHIDSYLHSSEKETDLSTILSKIGKEYPVNVLTTTTQERFKDTIQSSSLFLSSATAIHIQPTNTQKTTTLLLHNLAEYESPKRVYTFRAIKEIVLYASDVFPELPQPACSIKALDALALSKIQEAVITATAIDQFFSAKINAPIGTLTDDQKHNLRNMQSLLTDSVIGQDHAMEQLAHALKRSQLELNKKDKTMGSFLFLGATGVGKTETAKTLADILFHTAQKLIRVDCAEYITPSSLESLIGNHTGNQPGILTEAVKRQPYSVVLLDEIEKAHEAIRLALMTIFDEGYLQNGKGEQISFRHTILIATSNAGSEKLYQHQNTPLTTESLIDYLVSNHLLKPEFINRFDGVVLFQPLDYGTVTKIAQLKLTTFTKKLLAEKGITLSISDRTYQKIFAEGYSSKFGARYLERAINRIVVDQVADALLAEEVKAGGELVV